jgi:hypothetical protein
VTDAAAKASSQMSQAGAPSATIPNMDLVAGTALGFAASFMLWLVLAHAIRPAIEWTDVLYRDPDSDEPIYRFGVRNRPRRRRHGVDVKVSAVLYCRANDTRYKPIIRIALNIEELPRLRGTRLIRFRIRDEDIDASLMRAMTRAHQLPASGDLIEAIIATCPEASIRVYLLCYDSFTGARRLAVKDYACQDLRTEHIDVQSFRR